MAKTVTHAVEFRDPRQPTFGPDRMLFVLVCDDGSVYEFQRIEDSPLWNLRSRGSKSKPRHQWSQSHAPLPSDVTETLDEILGKKKWTK